MCIRDRDTLVIFSAGSRVYKDILDALADTSDERKPHIVLITMSRKNPLNAKVNQDVYKRQVVSNSMRSMISP